VGALVLESVPGALEGVATFVRCNTLSAQSVWAKLVMVGVPLRQWLLDLAASDAGSDPHTAMVAFTLLLLPLMAIASRQSNEEQRHTLIKVASRCAHMGHNIIPRPDKESV